MKLKYRTPAGLTYYPYLVEMIENNHTLIAGTTGAGKSVLENAIIYSLLCCKFPFKDNASKAARFILIDPKKVELDLYKKLPHTLLYVDTIPDTVKALYYIRHEIDRRFTIMKKKWQRKTEETPIYVFIDELVDLVTNKQHGKEIVRLLSDCASISRACNIFFVCLTQSPSRVIIPAAFKLLFNCRVALRCNNAIESRQIIDDSSAVEIDRHGIAIVQENTERYQIVVPLIPDADIINLVKFWERQHPIINALTRQKLN